MKRIITEVHISFEMCNCGKYPRPHGRFRINDHPMTPEICSLEFGITVLQGLMESFSLNDEDLLLARAMLGAACLPLEMNEDDALALEEARLERTKLVLEHMSRRLACVFFFN